MKNMISSLLVQGVKVTDFEKIDDEVNRFFSNLHRKEHLQRPYVDNLFDSQILREVMESLEKPFQEDEVKETIFWMDNAKALDLDGFSMLCLLVDISVCVVGGIIVYYTYIPIQSTLYHIVQT